VYEYALLGNMLWKNTFGGAGEKLKDLLADVNDAKNAADKQKKPLRIVINAWSDEPQGTYKFVLPFQLLFDDSEFLREHKSAETVQSERDWQRLLQGFWGFKYIVVYPVENDPHPHQLSKVGVQPVWSKSNTELLSCISFQGSVFDDLRGGHPETVQVEQPLDREEDLRDLLKSKTESPELIYYYSHSYSDPGGNTSISGLHLDRDSRGISVNELVSEKTEPFNGNQPILFLNSCSSAEFASQVGIFNNLVNSAFIDYLSHRGFAGLLGPEQPVEIRFASQFASEFFERWVHSGQSLEDVLYSMRHRALEDPRGNPFVLLYSYFGNGQVQLNHDLVDAAKNAPHWHHLVSNLCSENLGQSSKN